MRVITYSDLHLELESSWALPHDVDADLMILEGDPGTTRVHKLVNLPNRETSRL